MPVKQSWHKLLHKSNRLVKHYYVIEANKMHSNQAYSMKDAVYKSEETPVTYVMI